MAPTASVSADIPRPKQVKPTITIQRNNLPGVTRLIIPQKFLPDGEQKVGAAPAATKTIIAGIALSAGIVLGGLVLVRSRGLRSPAVAAAVVFGGLLIGGGYVAANAPAPPPPPPTAVTTEDREVSVTVVPEGDRIMLILDKDTRLNDVQ
jgi:hypothetical protein